MSPTAPQPGINPADLAAADTESGDAEPRVGVPTMAVGPEPAARAPHQALYRRWRAQTFAEIVGQAAVVETLRNAVRAGRVSHALLFVGPRGTGKTSLARIVAKAVNCTDLRDGDPCDRCEACVAIRDGRAIDLVEIDAASNRGIDAIRDLRERIHYAPTDLRRKVYILDEAHQITKDAWNALLKSLEEPPDFVLFIFASTHPQEFPPAILSRLQRYDVRRLAIDEIEGKLARILEAESVTAEPGAIHLIARLAAGGMRDAESMLDQVLASASGRIDEASVRDLLGLADADAVSRLASSLVDGDASAGISVLGELDERGRDVAVVLDQVVDALRTDLATAVSTGDILGGRRLAAAAHRLAAIDPERRGVGGLRFQLELALLDAATASPAPSSGTREHVATSGVAIAADDKTPRPTSSPSPSRSGPGSRRSEPQPPTGQPEPDAAADGHARPPSAVVGKPATRALDPATRAPDRGTRAPDPATLAPDARMATPGAPPLAAADTAPAPTAEPSPPGGVGTGIDELRAAWPEVVAALSQNPPVKPLIAACRPVSVEGPVVTLGFPEDQAFLKDALERRRSMLEDGIGRVLGRPVNVRCVATNLEHVPVVATADAADLISEARRIFADDLVDVGEVS